MDFSHHAAPPVNFRAGSSSLISRSSPSEPPAEPAFDPSSDIQHTSYGERTPLLGVATQGVKSNIGLLLITAAQLFLAIVNLLVKKLQATDPPVGTLEV